MRILLIGDIYARSGRKAVKDNLLPIKQELKIDMVIANAENAAGGNGLTPAVASELFEYGIDVMTMGNHVWDKKDIISLISKEPRIIRPANYPKGTPGEGMGIFSVNGYKVAVMNLCGRIFMNSLDCPFIKADELVIKAKKETDIIIVDFHAEASSEKIALGWYLDGRVSTVVGTHTHVQTADERILPSGTAYITDLGMTGPQDSVIGVKTELVLQKFITQMPVRFEPAEGSYQFCAVYVDIDETTGLATSIERIHNLEF